MVLNKYDIVLKIGGKKFRFKNIVAGSEYGAQRKLLDNITVESITDSKPDPIEESEDIKYFKNLFGMN